MSTPTSNVPQTARLAFVSVYDKSNLEPLVKALHEEFQYGFIATGGTFDALKKLNLPVVEVADVTGFGHMLEGRVKSLHPHIFGGILAKKDTPEHTSQVPFLIDTVIVNLYPFWDKYTPERPEEQTTEAPTPHDPSLVEWIDIGGSALIRSAAKNYKSTHVLSSPGQYNDFLAMLRTTQGNTPESYRSRLAQEAFALSAAYDGSIATYFQGGFEPKGEGFPETLSLPLMKIQDLRYGENPHQKAALFGLGHNQVKFNVLNGKALSFNNLLDMESAWALVNEFTNEAACAIIKHNQPCGVASSDRTLYHAFKTAFYVDSLSAFGGVVALNRPVDLETAKEMKDIFLEVIVAPSFEADALELLKGKKNLRLVEYPVASLRPEASLQIKQASTDLFLVQSPDRVSNERSSELPADELFECVTEKKPTAEQLEDLYFAWKVVKHVKSNAIVVAKDRKTVGICGGQTSRIGAMEHALKHACDESKDAVMASDGFLPAEDNIHAAVQARISAIVQPGGSIKDPDIIRLANQYDIAMVTTGIREFRH